MRYRPDKTAEFVGVQRVDGPSASARAAWCWSGAGTFDGEARGGLAVVPGPAPRTSRGLG